MVLIATRDSIWINQDDVDSSHGQHPHWLHATLMVSSGTDTYCHLSEPCL